MLTIKQELIDNNYLRYETFKEEGNYILHLDFRVGLKGMAWFDELKE